MAVCGKSPGRHRTHGRRSRRTCGQPEPRPSNTRSNWGPIRGPGDDLGPPDRPLMWEAGGCTHTHTHTHTHDLMWVRGWVCNFIDTTSISICVCRVFVSFHAEYRPYANKKALEHYSMHTYGPAHKPPSKPYIEDTHTAEEVQHECIRTHQK